MGIDIENLGAAPEIESLDLTAMDRGDKIEGVDDKQDDKAAEAQAEKDLEEALGKKDAKAEEPDDEDESDKDESEDEKDEQPRDDKGRFDKKEAKIPKSRFDEAVNKEREAREAAERRAAELERKLNETARQEVKTQQIEELETKISGLEKQHADFLLDGEAEKAAAVMKEIRHAERLIARAEADEAATRRVTQTIESQAFETVVARLEADHPEFNPQSESYDVDLVELVLSKQQTLMRTEGLSPSKAMEKAGKDVADRFLKKVEAQKEEPKGLAKKTDRAEEQLKKNLETQKKQPTSMRETGIDSDKAGQTSLPDVSKMTQDEFNALPPSMIARLRGDVV